jgi:hypothetical protein
LLVLLVLGCENVHVDGIMIGSPVEDVLTQSPDFLKVDLAVDMTGSPAIIGVPR